MNGKTRHLLPIFAATAFQQKSLASRIGAHPQPGLIQRSRALQSKWFAACLFQLPAFATGLGGVKLLVNRVLGAVVDYHFPAATRREMKLRDGPELLIVHD